MHKEMVTLFLKGERIIPSVDDFVITLKNTGSGTARVQYFLDWYEGEPDLPRPE